MTDKVENKELIVNVNDKEIPVSELPEQAQYLVTLINNVNVKLANLQVELDQLTLAKNAASAAIVELVEAEADAEETDVE